MKKRPAETTPSRSAKKKTSDTPRPRDAVATRKAILDSARRAFARSGYDGVGVREIAAGAGVTAMLINRYFGSKERLFAEVAIETMTKPVILTSDFIESGCPSETMAAALVRLTQPDATPLEGFLIMLRSAASERAAEIGREQIQAHYQTTLARALHGPDRSERAAVILSLVAGFQMMRQAMGLPALTDAKPGALERVLERALRALIEPPPSK
ncbi:TetR/AcrR family transcriptional regulator [Pendulispora rubella]|uniref:TetR/AcrR family transcriptional regulator n=1 Tax=Pendulispora rubella TaxID=2741070 RepID=A0ABZ2L665_9BACT